MPNILHVSCSPNGQAAESLRLSRRIVRHLVHRDPSLHVVERVVGDGSVAHIDTHYALLQHAASGDVSPGDSAARSEQLIQELEQSDVLVIGTPMHNLGLPSALKSWIDHVVRAGRTFGISREGKKPLLRDRPVYVAVASGGLFSGERARQPDFLTPYLRTILAQVGLRDLTFFSVEGTAYGTEALDRARSEADLALRSHFEPRAVDVPVSPPPA